MTTIVSKILTSYSVNLLCLHHWCSSGKFMNISEAASGDFLWKKLFLKFSQHPQQSCRPATLLKAESNTGVFLSTLQNFKEHLFRETCARWAVDSELTLLLTSDNLLTDYEQLNY